MSTNTTNYGFKKPAQTDNYNIDDQNVNWDQADITLKQQSDNLNTHKNTAILDHPDGSVTDAKIGNRTIDDTVVATGGEDTPTRVWSKLANMIKQITGKGNWFTAPVKSIEQLNTDISNHTVATSAHGSTPSATPNAIMQRDGNNQANVGTPTAASHIARKKDVDAVSVVATAALPKDGSEPTTGPISLRQQGGGNGANTWSEPLYFQYRDASGILQQSFLQTNPLGSLAWNILGIHYLVWHSGNINPLSKDGDRINGDLIFTNPNTGIYGAGTFNAANRIWAFDPANKNYGLFYKQNSLTGNDEIAFTPNGDIANPTASIGKNSGLVVNSEITSKGTVLMNSSYPYKVGTEGFAYFPSNSPHLAYYKKSGGYFFSWRKSDNGNSGGANEKTLMELDDGGKLTLGLSDIVLQQGGLKSLYNLPLRSFLAGHGSFAFHNSTNGWFYLVPSASVDAEDWDYGKGIRINKATGQAQINNFDIWHQGNMRYTNGFLEFWNDTNKVWQGAGGVKNVQRGVTRLQTGSDGKQQVADILINPFNMSKSGVRLLTTYSGNPGINISLSLINGNGIRISYNFGSNAAADVSWEVEEFY